jgi:hypothetical protein
MIAIIVFQKNLTLSIQPPVQAIAICQLQPIANCQVLFALAASVAMLHSTTVEERPWGGPRKNEVNEQALYARSPVGDAAASPARARAVLG